MGRRYGRADRVPEEAAWAHKYIMILDGNTFSSRLMRTLRSGSLVFRAGLFTEWFDERLEPFLHYLPVRQQLQLSLMDDETGGLLPTPEDPELLLRQTS